MNKLQRNIQNNKISIFFTLNANRRATWEGNVKNKIDAINVALNDKLA